MNLENVIVTENSYLDFESELKSRYQVLLLRRPTVKKICYICYFVVQSSIAPPALWNNGRVISTESVSVR